MSESSLIFKMATLNLEKSDLRPDSMKKNTRKCNFKIDAVGSFSIENGNFSKKNNAKEC